MLLFSPVILVIANLTCSMNVTSINTMFACANQYAYGDLGIAISAFLFVIILSGLIYKGSDIAVAGLSAAFICTFVSLALIGLNVMPDLFILVYVALDALFFMMLQFRGSTSPY